MADRWIRDLRRVLATLCRTLWPHRGHQRQPFARRLQSRRPPPVQRAVTDQIKAAADRGEARAQGKTKAGEFVAAALSEVEIHAAVAGLAELPIGVYESARVEEAKRLRMRASVLDMLVKAARRKRDKPAVDKSPEFNLDELRRSAAHIVENPDILSLFAADFSRVIAGEAANGKLLYLVATSRMFAKTMNAAIKGTSAGGKSEIRRRVLEFFPPESVVSFTSLSEKALYYYDGDFSHKVFSMAEACASEELAFQDYLLRELMSEGRLVHQTVQKVGSELVSMVIEKEGPVAFLVTTTKNKLHPENETRMLSLEIDDTEGQTKKVLDKVAQVEGLKHATVQVDYKPWLDFQRWLERGERRVVVPFAIEMARLIPPAAVRLRRDLGQVIRAIQAHALLHREQRGRDADGQVIADIEHDYEAARVLMNAILAEGSGVAISAAMTETIEAVISATEEGLAETEGASAKEVAEVLKLDKSAARRRLLTACLEGFVVNLEHRKGVPGRYRTTSQKAETVAILPPADNLIDAVERVRAGNPPSESMPPCHRDEIAEDSLEDHGGKDPCHLHATACHRWHGGNPVANGFATVKLFCDNEESPPVARWQGFSEGTGGTACNDADRDTNGADILVGTGDRADRATQAGTLTDVEAAHQELQTREAAADDLSIPAFLDRRGEACAHCGIAVPPGERPFKWDDGQEVRLHPHCADAWAEAQHAQRKQPPWLVARTAARAAARAGLKCERCGKLLDDVAKLPNRRFCSDVCRQAAHRARRSAEDLS
jgi:hypothetical protein